MALRVSDSIGRAPGRGMAPKARGLSSAMVVGRDRDFGFALAMMSAFACSPVVEEPLGSSSRLAEERVRSTEQATVTSPVELFQAAIDAGAIVAGTTAVYIGDRVEVKTASNGFAPISNTGTGTTPNFVTQLGTDAKTGTLWSRTKVDLRDRAHVHGAVRTNRAVTRGNQVIINGGIVAGPLGATTDILGPLPSVVVRGTTPLTIWPSEDINLQPGSYGAVTVHSGGTLRLDSDVYSFSNVIVEWGGKIVTKSDCSPATLEARSGFTFRGTVFEDGGNDPGIGLVVRYEGTNTSNIETAFRGILIAPKAEINLGAVAHEGRFFGKTVRIQASGSVKDFAPFAPASGECGTALSPPPAPVPSDIGPAPPLTTSADLDTFLDWFYVITKAEKAEAEAKIQAVSPTSGIRQAVIQRFEAARSSRAFGKALMLVAMLGALRDAEVRTFLIDLVNEPVPFSPAVPVQEGVAVGRYEEEVAYKRNAINILNAIQAPATEEAVMDAALNHDIREVRGAAIKALKYQKSAAEIEALRAQIHAEDEFYLDRASRYDSNFEAQLEAFRAKYSTN